MPPDEIIEQLSETESFGPMPRLSEIIFSEEGESSKETTASKLGSQLISSTGTERPSRTFEESITSSLTDPFQDQAEPFQGMTESKIGSQLGLSTKTERFSGAFFEESATSEPFKKKIKLIEKTYSSKYLFIKDLSLLAQLKEIYEVSIQCDEKSLQEATESYKNFKLLLETAKQAIKRQKEKPSSDEISLSILQVEAIEFIQSRELYLDKSFFLEELDAHLFDKTKKICLKIIKELKDECINYQLHLQSFIQRNCPKLINTPTNIKQKLIDELLTILENQDSSPEKKIFDFNSRFEIQKDLLKESRSILSSLPESIFAPTQTEGEKLCHNIIEIKSLNTEFINMLEKQFPADVHLESEDSEACDLQPEYFQ